MRKKVLSIIAIVVASLLLIGATKKNDYKTIKKNQALINEVYRHLITHYVDNFDLDAFTKESINNMLMDLDPYTIYLENEEKSGIEMLTRGKYGGVGIQIGRREKQLTVISPMENSPAKRAGILSGDKIIAIDGEETEDLSMDAAAKMIRGERGTKVILRIFRFGESEPIDFALVREDIKVKDISYSGIIDDNTGYIRLTRFSKNSDLEMKKALKDLMEQELTGIILDLRDNPGGLLNAAVNILDLLIEKGETVVWTEGKTNKSKRKYESKHDPLVPNDVNIIVLVNQGSASASEILAGTLQDLDRGVVIGRSTFGKGLVQTVYSIDKDRSLKITTAKYFIPSGRLIQKPGYLPDELLADTTKMDSIYYTKGGRMVSGGGGITPDHIVELDKVSPILAASWRNGLFFNFVQKHKTDYSSLADAELDQSIMAQFEEYIHSYDLDIFTENEADYMNMREKLFDLDSTNLSIQGAVDLLDSYFQQKALMQFDLEDEKLHHWLMVEFADYFGGEEGKVKLSATQDKDIMKALTILNDPMAYSQVFIPQ